MHNFEKYIILFADYFKNVMFLGTTPLSKNRKCYIYRGTFTVVSTEITDIIVVSDVRLSSGVQCLYRISESGYSSPVLRQFPEEFLSYSSSIVPLMNSNLGGGSRKRQALHQFA